MSEERQEGSTACWFPSTQLNYSPTSGEKLENLEDEVAPKDQKEKSRGGGKGSDEEGSRKGVGSVSPKTQPRPDPLGPAPSQLNTNSIPKGF